MKSAITSALSILPLALLAASVQARETMHELSIVEALNGQYKAQAGLSPDIQYFWGGNKPAVDQDLGEVRTSQKTNAFNKSDKEACEWALFSALKRLEAAARERGGNAVINIRSNYKNVEFVSDDKFQCGAGALMAGVALKGTVVRLK